MLNRHHFIEGKGSALVRKAVPGKRPRLRDEVWGIRVELSVSFLVSPVPSLEAGWARLCLLARRLPRSLHTNIMHHTLCRR